MLDLLKALNLGLRFALELCMLAGFAYWGFQGDKALWLKWLVGVSVPLSAIVLWGIFFAPRSAQRLSAAWGQPLSAGLLLIAAVALYSTGRTSLAIAFGAVTLINTTLALLWRQW